jgi:mycofactocin precursor
VHTRAVGPQVLGRGEALLDAAVEPRVRAHLVRRLPHRPVPHGDDDRDGTGEVHRHSDSEPPVEHGEHDEHPADEHHPAGRLRDDLPEELGHRGDIAVNPLDQLPGRVPPMELVVEAEDVPGDAQAQVVRRAPGGDRRPAGDDDGDDLRDDGDGEEDDRETNQFDGFGALGRPVDDLTHDERAGEHQQRARRDERAEPDPTTSVGPEEGDQGAPAGGGRCRHGPSLLSPVRSRVMDSDTATPVATVEQPVDDDALVEEELLVEEISIDGMCGVY